MGILAQRLRNRCSHFGRALISRGAETSQHRAWCRIAPSPGPCAHATVGGWKSCSPPRPRELFEACAAPTRVGDLHIDLYPLVTH